MLDAAGLRAAVRAGEHTGPTAGLAPGYTQANLVALPEADAFDFLRFCVANPKPCPVLDVTDPGSPEPAQIAPGADLRTDVPRYRICRDGELADEPTDASEHWRDDLVALPDRLLVHLRARAEAEGLPIRHVEQGVNVPMYRTSRRLHAGRPLLRPAGRLDAPDDARAGDPRHPDHLPLRPGPRRARSTSASRRRSGSTTSARPTTATRWRSATASCRCSGPAA